MAKYATLKAAVQAAIKTNGAQQITGQVLQTQLVNMITSLGKYFQSFGGLATPAGSFTAGDESVTFLAVEAGTYTNFGGAVLDGKTLHILAYDGDWADVDTLIPSGAAFEAALALAIKGAHSGIAEGIADTISAGTAQEFLQRQSGGDGVNCLKRIKGKTIAWNQLVDEDTTEVTIPSGHKYFAIIGGTKSVATSDGNAISVTGGVDIVCDLSRMFGTVNTPSTVAEFEALYPELYYAYNAGVLKSNDAAALLTDGFNQWDGTFSKRRSYLHEDGTEDTGQYALAYDISNYIPVIAGQTYYVNKAAGGSPALCFYDADKNFISGIQHNAAGSLSFTVPAGAAFVRDSISAGVTDYCINLSWSGYRNGEYEPYWQRVLALRITELTGIPEGGTEADRVTMFPNGLGGAGSAFDSIFVENGVTKARATMKRVAIPDLSWTNYQSGRYSAPLSPAPLAPATTSTKPNNISDKYTVLAGTVATGQVGQMWFSGSNVYVDDNATPSAGSLEYELATPIVYTDLQYADGTPFTMPATILVDNYGTERIQAPEGATTPSAPFCCDSNYSIGVANLVKRLAALENAE